MRRILSLILAVMLVALCFASCGSTDSNAEAGSVFYLNFKPEQDEQWQALAKKYQEATGIKTTVVTAAEGTYESTLTAEMDKSDPPTLFQVNGPVGLANWQDYCYDLSKSDVYKELKSDDFALKGANGEVYGIAYVIETYGIIYNKTILQKYFDAEWSTIKSIDALNNFDALSTVVSEIQAHKSDLGVDGAFTSAGMDSSSDWRFKTHLANMAIYYEYLADGIGKTDAIKGTYLENYKKIWDLYINYATCKPTDLASKTGTDAETEFKSGKAVFYQNGTWAYGSAAYDEATGLGLKDDEFGMLPIYMGVEGEENLGLCTGSENYWCVNAKADEADIKATLDFLKWVVTDDVGTSALANDMGFVIPFKNAKEASNPLVKIANDYVTAGKTSVSWNFPTIPSEDWKNGVGAALTQYAAGTGSWDDVKLAFVDGWAREYKKANG